jgi:hypothetical protein
MVPAIFNFFFKCLQLFYRVSGTLHIKRRFFRISLLWFFRVKYGSRGREYFNTSPRKKEQKPQKQQANAPRVNSGLFFPRGLLNPPLKPTYTSRGRVQI